MLASLLLILLLLLLLFGLPEISANELVELLALDFLIGDNACLGEGSSTGEERDGFWLDGNGSTESSNELARLITKNWVVYQEVVVEAFSNTNLGTSKVLESSDGEWEGWVLLVDNREENSSVLGLELVGGFHFSLEDGGSHVNLLHHTFTRGDEDVETEDVSSGELVVLNSLLWGLFVNNDFVSVVEMLLHLMGKDTLNWVDLESLTDFSDFGSNILVKTTNMKDLAAA